jgi:hypothetical protein
MPGVLVPEQTDRGGLFQNPAPELHSFYKLELELDALNASIMYLQVL